MLERRTSVAGALASVVASAYHRLRRSRAGPLMLRAIDRAAGGRAAVPATVRAGPLVGMTLELDPRVQADVVIGAYERHASDVIRRSLQAGDTAFDVGSHFGYFALLMSASVAPGGRVICFEPDREVFATLERNVARNARIVGTDVTAVNMAIAGSAGARRFARGGHTSRGSLSDVGEVEVSAITLDDAVARHGVPALVKIDVEGGELQVLDGGSELLRAGSTVFVIETHSAALLDACRARLRSHGYDVVELSERGRAETYVVATPRSAG
ncbi:MAG TPA: FkbM family methyltransferase [Actinomycetota bacterium]|nr:FkbM family methyltransferase [Actinomycetota bacterium]